MISIGIRLKTIVALAACLLLAAAGCGGSEFDLAEVNGQITLDGQPLSGGTVEFVPQSGPAASGAIGVDGRYTLTTIASGDGAVVGRHTVTVQPPTAGVALTPGQPPMASSTEGVQIPLLYQRRDTSPLQFEVLPSGNDFAIELLRQESSRRR